MNVYKQRNKEMDTDRRKKLGKDKEWILQRNKANNAGRKRR